MKSLPHPVSPALQVEVRSIQNQLKHALQNHQYWVGKQTKDPMNHHVKKQIIELQKHIVALDESQKFLVERLRKEIAAKQRLNEKRGISFKNVPANSLLLTNINSLNMSSKASGCNNNCTSSNSSSASDKSCEVSIRTPPPPPLVSAPGIKIISKEVPNKAPKRKVTTPKSSPPLTSSNKNNSNNLKKDENSKNFQNDSLINEESEEENQISQIDFLRALNLVTRDKLYELQNKRVERKRRSTANHSQYVYDDLWDTSKKKRNNYLNNSQGTGPATRQVTRSQVKVNANNSKSGKVSPPAVGSKNKGNSQPSKRQKTSHPPKEVAVSNTNGLKEAKEVTKRKSKTPSPPPLKAAPINVKKLIQSEVTTIEIKTQPTIEIDTYPKSFSNSQEKRVPSMDEIIRRDESSSLRGCSLTARSEPPSSDRYKRCVESVHIDRIGASPIGSLTPTLPLNIQKLPASLTIERVDKELICVICRKQGPQSVCNECTSPYHSHQCGSTSQCRACHIGGLQIVQRYLHRTDPKSMTISTHGSLKCSTTFSSMKTSFNSSLTVTTVPPQTNKLKIDKEEKSRLLVANRELIIEKEKLESRKAQLKRDIQAQSDFRQSLESSETVYRASIRQIQEFIQKMRNDPAPNTLTIANLNIKPSRSNISSMVKKRSLSTESLISSSSD